ncbi:hypothetical protein K2P56_03590 [Patescibacteria group bacterium]|nr:hypothetical protein [Patescibacteria group bacterium]
MTSRNVMGHEEAALIRTVNARYAEEAARVVKALQRQAGGGRALEHLNAVRAGLTGKEAPKRTGD